MMKTKGKSKTSKKAAKKSTPKKGKEPNPAEVRKEVALMVESEAAEMAQAVIDRGKMGELPTVKYLFEVAAIYPPSTDGSQSSKEEDSLAKTLMDRLNLPDEPIARDEEGEPLVAPVAKPDDSVGEPARETSGSESKG